MSKYLYKCDFDASFKVVPGGCHRFFFGVKVKTVNGLDDLKGAI